MNLLSLDKIFTQKLFRIPDFQRGYAWQDSQLKDFWEDLVNLSGERKHYSGVLTIRKIPKKDIKSDSKEFWLVGKPGYDVYEVVDGQQRLTTFVIFIQAFVEVYKNIEQNKNKSEVDITISGSVEFSDVIKNYLYKVKPDGTYRTYKFGYTEDNPSYQFMRYRIFNEQGGGEIQESFYTSNLADAKLFFETQLKAFLAKYGLDELDELFSKITQSFMFNEYEIENEFDVFVAFETMNNRGKKLSNLELLKNRLIYLTSLFPENEIDEADRTNLRKEINDAWQEIYHQLGRNKSIKLPDDDFLKAHWIMYFMYSRKRGNDYIKFLLDTQFSPKRLYEKTSYNQEDGSDEPNFKDYDEEPGLEVEEDNPVEEKSQSLNRERININEINSYILSLKASAIHWFNTFYPHMSSLDELEKAAIARLNRIGMGYFRPLLMSILKNESNSQERIKAFNAIERFIFLAFRLSQTRSNYQDSIFYNAARELEHKEISLENIYEKINEALKDYFDEGIFKIKSFAEFINKKFTMGDKAGFYRWYGLHYFLYEYELSLYKQAHGRAVMSWDVLKSNNKIKDNISVEHIYPQTPNDEYWKGKFPSNDANMILYQGSLGNLLLLSSSVNSQLQNDSFPEKKKEKRNEEGVELRTGYNKGSFSEIEVANNKDWTPVEIESRGMKLLKFLQDNWDIKFHSNNNENEKIMLTLLNLPDKNA